MVALAAVMLLAGAACSSESDEDPTAGTDDADTETTEPAGDDEDDGDAADEDAGPADGDEQGDGDGDGDGESEGDESEPLGSATARLPANPNDSTLVPLRLDVAALERLEGMVELRVTVTSEGRSTTPDFEVYSSFDDPRLPTGDGIYSLSGAALVDADDERQYLTIVDSEGVCLCTGRLAQVAVAPGDSFEMYADFGGVPDDVDQVDVQVPGFPTVDAVPID
jgi:hypothetical protein